MKFPNYKKQMFEFFDEVNKIYATGDKRQMVLLLGIYSEYLTNELLRVSFPKDRLQDIFSEKIKLDILKANRLLAESEYEVLDLLRKVRNEYAHNLEVNESKIENMMKKIKINWAVDEKKIKELDEQFDKIPYTKFQSGTITKLIFLFQRLGGFLPK